MDPALSWGGGKRTVRMCFCSGGAQQMPPGYFQGRCSIERCAFVSLGCRSNRNSFSNSSGGQGSKTKELDGLVPPGALRQNLSHACPNFCGHYQSLTFLGFQMHHSNLCLCLHRAFSLCPSMASLPLPVSSPYKDTSR